MNEQFKEQITYKAREFAAAYTNRHFPNQPAFAFGNEGWTKFVDALVELAGAHPDKGTSALTPIQNAWYWVRFESLGGLTDWAPAMLKGKAWYSYQFSGIPCREVEVGPALIYAAPVVPAPGAYRVQWADIGEGESFSLFYDDNAKEHMESAVSYALSMPVPRKAAVIPLYAAIPPQAAPVAQLSEPPAQPRLKVRLTAFPESNGKRNWTALLMREDQWDGLVGNCGGISLARGEMWNRVAWEAECARFLIGQRDTEPYILDYGDDIKTPEEWKGEVDRIRRAAAPTTPKEAPCE